MYVCANEIFHKCVCNHSCSTFDEKCSIKTHLYFSVVQVFQKFHLQTQILTTWRTSDSNSNSIKFKITFKTWIKWKFDQHESCRILKSGQLSYSNIFELQLSNWRKKLFLCSSLPFSLFFSFCPSPSPSLPYFSPTPQKSATTWHPYRHWAVPCHTKSMGV